MCKEIYAMTEGHSVRPQCMGRTLA